MLFGLLLTVVSGFATGSFLNLCLDRLPLQVQKKKREQKLNSQSSSSVLKEYLEQQTLSPCSPVRSFCFSCGKQLFWYENIPILSCLINQARCRQCGSHYGWRTLYVEGITGLLFGLVYLFLVLD